MDEMSWLPLALLGAWIVAQYFVLPKLGIRST
jgi:hypothetical protein